MSGAGQVGCIRPMHGGLEVPPAGDKTWACLAQGESQASKKECGALSRADSAPDTSDTSCLISLNRQAESSMEDTKKQLARAAVEIALLRREIERLRGMLSLHGASGSQPEFVLKVLRIEDFMPEPNTPPHTPDARRQVWRTTQPSMTRLEL
jgi:hypothetical protein